MTHSLPYTEQKRPLVLHIGMPKTGTTSLQELLFSKHPDIYYLGKNKSWQTPKQCRTPEVYRFLAPSLWPNAKETSSQTNIPVLREVIADASSSQVLLGSWEGLSAVPLGQHTEMLHSLVDSFGICKILICLRNPLTLMPSLYLQSLRGRQNEQNQIILQKGWYCEIDIWLKRWKNLGGFENLLAYGERIRNSIDLLGRENVGIFLYEDLCGDSQRFVRELCRFIGIDETLGVSLVGQDHRNKRLTQGQVDFMKRVERSVWKRWCLGWLSPARQITLLDRQDPNGEPARVPLPDEWKERISKHTRDGNRWLVDNLQLPLGDYQYPL